MIVFTRKQLVLFGKNNAIGLAGTNCQKKREAPFFRRPLGGSIGISNVYERGLFTFTFIRIGSLGQVLVEFSC